MKSESDSFVECALLYWGNAFVMLPNLLLTSDPWTFLSPQLQFRRSHMEIRGDNTVQL